MRLRHRMLWIAACGAVACIAFTGCAVEDLRPDYETTREAIREGTGASDVYDPEAPLLTAEDIGSVLDGGLSLDEALRLALLNNRRLQAGFMGLGVARADYVQAGLLENPSLGVALLFPSGGGRTRLGADLAQGVMDIWRLPSRRLAASANSEQRALEVARLAGELVVQTQEAYFECIGTAEARTVAQESAEIAQRMVAAVRQRLASGVAPETEANLAEGVALNAGLQARRAEREEVLATRRLAALLSLEGDLLGVPLTTPLPEPLSAELGREAFVERARSERLDLRVMAAAVTAAEARVELERGEALPDLSLGLAAERPEGGSSTDLLVGPAATVELPIFDRNETQISRAEFEREELRKSYEAALSEAVQEVRAATDRAQLATRALAFIDDELQPQSQRSVELTQRAYDLGDATLLMLLETQRAAIQARAARSDARLEAVLARLDLERRIGGPLERPEPPTTEP